MNQTSEDQDSIRVGILSDTHGLLRSEVIRELKAVDLILHAGDLGTREVLAELKTVAPVVAVRGNMDGGVWAEPLKKREIVPVGDILLYILHDIHDLDLDPTEAGIRAVISGHSHRPVIAHRNGVLFLNPGSAGPRRFDYPISIAILRVAGKNVDAKIVELDRTPP